jgi:HEAT repeat protein
MTRIVTLGSLVLFALTLVVTVAAVVARAVRLVRAARRKRLIATHRRLLLEFAAGEGDPDDLVRMPERTLRPSAIELLSKVRGEARDALAAVFERRGAAAEAMADLRRGGLVRRARAAELLGTLGHRPAVPELCLLLEDRNPDLRVVCVRALGRIGVATAAPALLRSLTGPRPTPSHLVAHALTQLGPEATPALTQALDHADPQVRLTALDALGLRGTAAARIQIAGLLAHDESLAVRTRAAAVLGRVGTKSTVDALLAATDVAQPAALRGEAARSLGELGIRPAVEPLARLLTDPHYQVAHQAARALLRLGDAGRKALECAAEGVPPAGSANGTAAAAHAVEALAAQELTAQRAVR